MFKNIFKEKKNNIPKKNCTIGIMGLSGGVGTTHAGLIIAGFLHAYYGRKTLVAEACGQSFLYHWLDCEDNRQNINKHGILYMLNADKEDILQIRNMGYAYCILDLGCSRSLAEEDLMRCDIKIIVGTAAVWQKDMWTLAKDILEKVQDSSTFNFLVNFGDISDDIRTSLLPAAVYPVPYEPDLSHITEDSVHLFRKIFKEYS